MLTVTGPLLCFDLTVTCNSGEKVMKNVTHTVLGQMYDQNKKQTPCSFFRTQHCDILATFTKGHKRSDMLIINNSNDADPCSSPG